MRRREQSGAGLKESFNTLTTSEQARLPAEFKYIAKRGKETNQDFLSSGERTGKSPAPNPAVPPQGNVVFGRIQ